MRRSEDQRSFTRVPIANRVKITTNGKFIAYVVAMNLSLGGILLKAQPALPIGAPCEVSILSADGDRESLHAAGKVIRTGALGTAVQFSRALVPASFRSVVAPGQPAPLSIAGAYRAYFQAGQDLEKCQTLLGVTGDQFRKVFYATFSGSLVAAVVPVWLLRASIPPYPALVKVILAFIYGALWLLLLQPGLDLAIFRWMRRKAGAQAG